MPAMSRIAVGLVQYSSRGNMQRKRFNTKKSCSRVRKKLIQINKVQPKLQNKNFMIKKRVHLMKTKKDK